MYASKKRLLLKLDRGTEVFNFSCSDLCDSSGSEWLRMVPWGLRKLLNFIKDRYGNPPVIITENGVSDRNSSMQDDHRVNFYRHYINNALKGKVIITSIISNNCSKGKFMYQYYIKQQSQR